MAVDENHSARDAVDVISSTATKSTGGYEDSLRCPLIGKCADESLQLRPLHRVACTIPLCLNVNAIQAESVLIDDAVNAAITCTAKPANPLLRSPVTHCDEKVNDCLLEEVWMLFTKTTEKVCGHLRLESRDS